VVVLMPLPGTQIFHRRWNEYHRPTATASMDAECIITRPTSTGTTAPNGTYRPGSRTTIYTGVCRVLRVIRPAIAELIGETQETHRHYEVGVRYDCPDLAIDDLVEVTVAADTGLIGKKLRIIDITFGSEQWQRTVLCDEREA
jgi:Family of unknown function (DUF6093)